MSAIEEIHPMDDYLMEVKFDNGNIVILNLKNKLHTVRFKNLQDKNLFKSATTDGTSIRWNDLIEISITEIFEIVKSSKTLRG